MTRRRFIAGSTASIVGLGLIDAFWLEPHFVETKEFFIGPATRENAQVKVIQISDLHLKAINKALSRIINEVAVMEPDLILLTGDAIDKAENLDLLDEFLSLLGKVPKAAILGNWEYWSNTDLRRLREIYRQNNCDLLINETRSYQFNNRSISVTGIDDLLGGHPDIDLALKNYQKTDFHIVLNHCPQYNDVIAEKAKGTPIDLILSGHTHGGQINVFGFAPILPKGSGKYISGWYRDDGMNLYVSKGVGTSVLPARFGARAEIATFSFFS